MTTKELYELLIKEALKHLHLDFDKYLALLEMAYDLRMANEDDLSN